MNDIKKNIKKKKDLENFELKHMKIGSKSQQLTNALFGIDIYGNARIPTNRETYGITFFTRPQLRLTDDNVILIRKLHPLLSTERNSIYRFVRMTLDPRLGYNMEAQKGNSGYKKLESDIIDNKMAFIPILTNTIKSITGWPDIVLPTYTTKEGLKREQQSIGDGFTSIYNSFDLDVTFRNVAGEPHSHIFTTWINYISEVFEGNLTPYLDMITENEIDYNTRIYKLVLSNGGIIRKIACTGAAFPLNVPTGKHFDESVGTPLNTQNKDINIRFKCDGAMYNEHIIFKWFNETACIFNPELKDVLKGKNNHNYKRVEASFSREVNNRAYPLIDVKRSILTWWVHKDYIVEEQKGI